MKRNVKQKKALIALLTASCIGITISGCAAETENADERNEQNAGQEITAEDMQFLEPVSDESIANDLPADDSTTNESSVNDTNGANSTPADPSDMQETPTDSQSLYEQFLNNNAAITVSSDYPRSDYMEPIFDAGNSYTLSELGTRVSQFFLDPEYTDKTSCDYIQYAYIDCPDTADTTDKNLLIKFVGLNIYSQNDDSYSVYIITENNGQLYVTGEYQCWARSATTAYANGIVGDSGSSGAGDHYVGLSVILSSGKHASIYSAEELFGWWTSYVDAGIYSEVFDENENAESNLIVSIYTIGDKRYYLYDTSECSEESKTQCENYINRCRDEAGINWVAAEEIQSAIQNQCSTLGIDYSIAQNRDEAVWNNL